MNQIKLTGKVCLRCKHIYVETADKKKRICKCKDPVLAPASLIHKMSIRAARMLPAYADRLGKLEDNGS